MTTRTLGEIEDLKAQWESDPHWDIEDTDGFEDHREELQTFHQQKKLEWQEQAKQRVRDKAAELGCPDNLKLARYVMDLEYHIDRLGARLEKLENA